MEGYKKEVRKAKRESWKDFCSSMEDTNQVSRLRKLLSKNPSMPRTIRKINGEWADSCEDSLEDLVSTHFPGYADTTDLKPRGDIVHDIPTKVITTNKIKWAIQSFDPYKSPGLSIRGTPQGGVLSPLLWLLVANELLKKFNGGAPKLVAPPLM